MEAYFRGMLNFATQSNTMVLLLKSLNEGKLSVFLVDAIKITRAQHPVIFRFSKIVKNQE
jgi:hypothetical protein